MPENSPNPAPLQLDYAATPSRWRKRARRILPGLLVVGLALGGWRWGPYAWHQSQLLYWQRQCLNYSASPDTVVYEEEPNAAAALRLRPNYLQYRLEVTHGNGNPTTITAAAYRPRCCSKLEGFANLPIGSSNSAVIFLHERISLAGNHRLVCVTYSPVAKTEPDVSNAILCERTVAIPATWTHPLFEPMGIWISAVFPAGESPWMTIYAGQLDPNDRSRFVIRYTSARKEYVIDGRLEDDDEVTLTPRNAAQ